VQAQAHPFHGKGVFDGFEFVSAYVALIQHGMFDVTAAEKVGTGQGGTFEIEKQGMLGGDAIKGVELGIFIQRHHAVDIGSHVQAGMAQVDVGPQDDVVQDALQLSHASPPDFGAATRHGARRTAPCGGDIPPPLNSPLAMACVPPSRVTGHRRHVSRITPPHEPTPR
jgi:hypothetical protein